MWRVNILGTFDQIFNELDDSFFAKQHIGQTISGQNAHELSIGQHFFTKIPLPQCNRTHPLICGITHQQVKQYAG